MDKFLIDLRSTDSEATEPRESMMSSVGRREGRQGREGRPSSVGPDTREMQSGLGMGGVQAGRRRWGGVGTGCEGPGAWSAWTRLDRRRSTVSGDQDLETEQLLSVPLKIKFKL